MVLPLNPSSLEILNDALHEFRQIGTVAPARHAPLFCGLRTHASELSLNLVCARCRQAYHCAISDGQRRCLP